MSNSKDGTRRVLPSVSEHPEIFGRTYIEWGKMALPTVLGLYLSAYILPDAISPVGFVLTVGIAAGSLIAIVGSPSHLTAGEFVAQRVNHHIQQPVMLHDRNPNESTIEQPKNESRLRSALNKTPTADVPLQQSPGRPRGRRRPSARPRHRASREGLSR